RTADQLLAVIVAEHRRNGQETHNRFGGPDHTGRTGEDDAHHDGCNGQAAGKPVRPQMDCREKALRNSRALQESAHEYKQGDRGKYEIGRYGLDTTHKLPDENVTVGYKSKYKRYGSQTECNMISEEYQQKQSREHPESSVFHQSISSRHSHSPRRTARLFSTSDINCIANNAKPAKRTKRKGHTTGFQADCPDRSLKVQPSRKNSQRPKLSHTEKGSIKNR